MIDPKLVTLAQLLEGRLFRIPEYQRAYSWSDREREDLFADIDDVVAEGKDHFMATVVVLERTRQTIIADEYSVVEVVDGQQRLTTLILLLRALERGLIASVPGHAKLRAQLQDLLVKDDALSLILLQTNHDTSHVFVDYVREGKLPPEESLPATRAERALRDAITECEAYIAEKGADHLLTLAATLRNRLTFIVHTLADEATVYTVFEVLNSRGLPVAWIDRLKSMLMAIAFEGGDPGGEHLHELHETWKTVYRALGLRQGMSDEALRFAAVLLTGELQKGRLPSPQDSATAIRQWCGSSTKKAIEASRWLATVVDAMNDLYGRSELAPLVSVSQARFVGVAVRLAPLSVKDKERVLAQWERTVFRVFGIGGKDARTHSGAFVRLGIALQKGQLDGDAARDQLARLAGDKSFGTTRESLSDQDCYWGWSHYLRFLLYRYEQHLAKEAGEDVDPTTWTKIWNARPDDTIEHVLPQSAADGDGWTSDGVLVHRLGNLIVLPPGVNYGLGPKKFADKRGVYADTPLRHVREVGAQEKWNKKAIKEREERIIAWAEKEFGK